MPVGLGPGGTNNDFCWKRNYNSGNGHYCANDGDVILLNATIGESVKNYPWCTEDDFNNDGFVDIFDAVTGLESLSERNYSEYSDECIRKEHIDLSEILKLMGKIVIEF